MLEFATVLNATPAAIEAALPHLLPSCSRTSFGLLLELDRHAIAELAAQPINSLALDARKQRWFPAFTGNIELRELPVGRTHLKVTGIIIPGMGPIEDKRWEHSVVTQAIDALLSILTGHYSHAYATH